MSAQYRFGLGRLLGEDGRYARFQDAGFFRGDFAERVAQKDLMIEVDGRDHGERGVYDVSGIQPAAQPHFEHCGFHALAGEQQKSHGGDALKVSGVQIKFAGLEHPLGDLMDFGESLRRIDRA